MCTHLETLWLSLYIENLKPEILISSPHFSYQQPNIYLSYNLFRFSPLLSINLTWLTPISSTLLPASKNSCLKSIYCREWWRGLRPSREQTWITNCLIVMSRETRYDFFTPFGRRSSSILFCQQNDITYHWPVGLKTIFWKYIKDGVGEYIQSNSLYHLVY